VNEDEDKDNKEDEKKYKDEEAASTLALGYAFPAPILPP